MPSEARSKGRSVKYIPPYVQKAGRINRHLKAALKRCHKPKHLPKSLQNQILGLVAHWVIMTGRGEGAVHPGMKKLGLWADASERTARDNMRALELWKVAQSVGCVDGGAGLATLYQIDTVALYRILVGLGGNPSDTLKSELGVKAEPEREITYQDQYYARFSSLPEATQSGNEKGGSRVGRKGGKTAPRIYTITETSDPFTSADQEERLANVELGLSERQQKDAGEQPAPLEATTPKSHPLPGYPEKKHTHLDKPLKAASASFDGNLPHLSSDAEFMLDHLRQIGPSTYGACASALGWGATRAWQAEAELVSIGAVWQDNLGRMVVTIEHISASGAVLPFALGARANATTTKVTSHFSQIYFRRLDFKARTTMIASGRKINNLLFSGPAPIPDKNIIPKKLIIRVICSIKYRY